MSALLTTTMPNMSFTIEAIRETEFGQDVTIIIGGAPVTQEYADEIGVNGFASDAGQAATMAKILMANRQ